MADGSAWPASVRFCPRGRSSGVLDPQRLVWCRWVRPRPSPQEDGWGIEPPALRRARLTDRAEVRDEAGSAGGLSRARPTFVRRVCVALSAARRDPAERSGSETRRISERCGCASPSERSEAFRLDRCRLLHRGGSPRRGKRVQANTTPRWSEWRCYGEATRSTACRSAVAGRDSVPIEQSTEPRSGTGRRVGRRLAPKASSSASAMGGAPCLPPPARRGYVEVAAATTPAGTAQGARQREGRAPGRTVQGRRFAVGATPTRSVLSSRLLGFNRCGPACGRSARSGGREVGRFCRYIGSPRAARSMGDANPQLRHPPATLGGESWRRETGPRGSSAPPTHVDATGVALGLLALRGGKGAAGRTVWGVRRTACPAWHPPGAVAAYRAMEPDAQPACTPTGARASLDRGCRRDLRRTRHRQWNQTRSRLAHRKVRERVWTAFASEICGARETAASSSAGARRAGSGSVAVTQQALRQCWRRVVTMPWRRRSHHRGTSACSTARRAVLATVASCA